MKMEKSAVLFAIVFVIQSVQATMVYNSMIADPPGSAGTFATTDYRFQVYRGASSDLGKISNVTIGALVSANHDTTGQSFSVDIYNSSASLLGTVGVSAISTIKEDYYGYDILGFSFDMDVDVAANSYVLLDFNTTDTNVRAASPSSNITTDGWSMNTGVGNFTRYFNGYGQVTAIPEPATFGLLGLFGCGIFAVRRIFMI